MRYNNMLLVNSNKIGILLFNVSLLINKINHVDLSPKRLT